MFSVWRASSKAELPEIMISRHHTGCTEYLTDHKNRTDLGKRERAHPVTGSTRHRPVQTTRTSKTSQPPHKNSYRPKVESTVQHEINSVSYGNCLHMPGKLQGGQTVRYLLDTRASDNILAKTVFDFTHLD